MTARALKLLGEAIEAQVVAGLTQEGSRVREVESFHLGVGRVAAKLERAVAGEPREEVVAALGRVLAGIGQ